MKKLAGIVVLSILLVGSPTTASAFSFADFFDIFIPDQLRKGSLNAGAEKGVGGVVIIADPGVLSGDTSRAYYLPALASRSFAISNNGDLDLFLNKASSLSYAAFPGALPGDLAGAFTLNAGTERTIKITNPSTTTTVYLSKTDLGVITEGTSAQPVVFVNNARSTATPIDDGSGKATLASIGLAFTLNNATNRDIYVSRLISPLSIVTLSSPATGASTTIKFITSDIATLAGDSPSVYVVPAGTSRGFELTGILDNTRGTAGSKVIAVRAINYSYSSTLTPFESMSDVVQLRGLVPPAVMLESGAIGRATTTTRTVQTATSTATSTSNTSGQSQTPVGQMPSVTPTVGTTKSPSATPSITPAVNSSASPSVSASPAVSSSASPSPSPSGSTAVRSELLITAASTKIGSPIIENGRVVGYPVSFIFTAQARTDAAYISRSPQTAFVSQQVGFGSITPVINNITATPANVSGDGGGYYIIPASSTRTFNAFTIMRNDGLTTSGSKIFQINKINYGSRSSALGEFATVQNTSYLKAIVQLSAPTTPSPSASGSPTPSASPSFSSSPSPSSSATPTPVPTQSSSPSSSPSQSTSPSPSSTPSPSSSSTPTPSSSPAASASSSASPSSSSSPQANSGGGLSVQFEKPKKNLVATVFFAVGDALDAIFGR